MNVGYVYTYESAKEPGKVEEMSHGRYLPYSIYKYICYTVLAINWLDKFSFENRSLNLKKSIFTVVKINVSV